MAFEQIGNGGSTFKKFPTTYYGYTEPDEPKENYKRLKKDDFVEGYFLKTWQRDGTYGKQNNHTLVKEDGTHHVIPGSKDVDADFALVQKGLFTRYTYLGKQTFDYVIKEGPKTGQTGKAKAIKGLIQQDKDNACTFDGDEFTARVSLDGTAKNITEDNSKASSATDITADNIPF